MNKIFQHSNFVKLSTTFVFGIALYALIKIIFFDSLFDKTSVGMGVFLTIMFGALTIIIGSAILDIWFEKVIIYPNRIILKRVFKQKEILIKNIKGIEIEGGNAIIYSKDDSIILAFSSSLKNDEKLISYLSRKYNYLDEDE